MDPVRHMPPAMTARQSTRHPGDQFLRGLFEPSGGYHFAVGQGAFRFP